MKPDIAQEKALRKKIQNQIEQGFKADLRPLDSNALYDDMNHSADKSEAKKYKSKLLIVLTLVIAALGLLLYYRP